MVTLAELVRLLQMPKFETEMAPFSLLQGPNRKGIMVFLRTKTAPKASFPPDP